MRLRRTLAMCAGIVTITGYAILGQIGIAQAAATFQVCAQNGTGYCLNDWNGGLSTVAMYYNDNANNNNFFLSVLPECSGPGGAPCAEIVDFNNESLCVAMDASGGLGACGNPLNGVGAATGVIDWEFTTSACSTGLLLENRYWSGYFGSPYYLQSPGVIGQAVGLDTPPFNGTYCWGETGN
jgi:hypothetical protein